MDQVGDSGTAVSRVATLPSRDLQAALALIDVRDLSGTELALVIQARARLLAWVQAEAAVDIDEFVHCPPCSAVPTARVSALQEVASDELALLLHVAPMTGKYLVLDAVEHQPGDRHHRERDGVQPTAELRLVQVRRRGGASARRSRRTCGLRLGAGLAHAWIPGRRRGARRNYATVAV